MNEPEISQEKIRTIYCEIAVDDRCEDCADAWETARVICELEGRLSVLEAQIKALSPANDPARPPSGGIDLATAVLAGGDGPTPEPPADGLVRDVMLSLRPSWGESEQVRDKARAAILAVADWLDSRSCNDTEPYAQAAKRLRWEARG